MVRFHCAGGSEGWAHWGAWGVWAPLWAGVVGPRVVWTGQWGVRATVVVRMAVEGHLFVGPAGHGGALAGTVTAVCLLGAGGRQHLAPPLG